jgi:beta-lactamase regulating signal transducer with metallopeptidase domain
MDAGLISAIVCFWAAASLIWAALICAVAKRFDLRDREGWTAYWLAWLIAAAAPALAAPLLALVPAPVTPLQVDVALAISEITAPVQRDGLAFGAALAAGAGALIVFVGVAICAARVAVSGWRAASLIRRGAPFAEIGATRVLLSDASVAAFCVGGARPAVLMPRALLHTMTPAQLNMLVQHEVAHVRRGDPLLFLALQALDVLFWFNPFVRALTARTRLAAEIACDAAALESGAAKSDYARTLVRAIECECGDAPGAVAAFGRRGAGPRIRLAHILGAAMRKRDARLSMAIVAVACVFCLSGAAFAASTGRMAVFGDPVLISALSSRVTALYGSARCSPREALPQ